MTAKCEVQKYRIHKCEQDKEYTAFMNNPVSYGITHRKQPNTTSNRSYDLEGTQDLMGSDFRLFKNCLKQQKEYTVLLF